VLSSLRQRSSGTAAFTLIEMVIAMLILGVVMSVAGGVISHTFAGSSKSVNERSAISSVSQAMSNIETSVRATKSPDRDSTVLPGTADLAGSLLKGTSITGRRSVNGSQITLDVQDVVEADGDHLLLRSDVLANPGVECVLFNVVTAANGDRSLVQSIWNGNPPGAPPADCIALKSTPPTVSKTLISTVGNVQ
jgi:prepilin-type N-terminal cleavage/methylation domain-containing protein